MRDDWSIDDLERLGRCPVCAAEGARPAYRGLRDRLFNSTGHGWDSYACGRCGTWYLDPRPTPQSIGRAYAEYLTHAPAGVAGVVPDRRSPGERARRLLRGLGNGYRNARWGLGLQPHSALGRYVVPFIPPLRDAIAMQMRHLPDRPAGPGAALLDVGCGNGAFLELARRAGWRVQGCDFDPQAVAAARSRGLDVRQGGLDVLRSTDAGAFDRITLSHVLEHVHAPTDWLGELHRLVRPGGALWLQTPNIDSFGHARYAEYWFGLDAPRHLTLWTADTLCQALREAGFRHVQLLPTPTLTGMEWYAASEVLQAGGDYAAFAALPRSRQLPLRQLVPGLRQHRSLRHGEAHTVLASK